MREAPQTILDTFVTEFCGVIERHTSYIIVSGFVAIAAGRTRGTEDIDMILPRLKKEPFLDLHRDLLAHNFVGMLSDDPTELYEYLHEGVSIRYTWKDRPLPEMEIKFTKDELDTYQLQTRQKIP
ncbi:hypothetical protein HY639_04585 [Candidatus Woesearchaeota archaeon]|nr:hypothetical protein [Candidatus Woesearchaeota archaeon]